MSEWELTAFCTWVSLWRVICRNTSKMLLKRKVGGKGRNKAKAKGRWIERIFIKAVKHRFKNFCFEKNSEITQWQKAICCPDSQRLCMIKTPWWHQGLLAKHDWAGETSTLIRAHSVLAVQKPGETGICLLEGTKMRLLTSGEKKTLDAYCSFQERSEIILLQKGIIISMHSAL